MIHQVVKELILCYGDECTHKQNVFQMNHEQHTTLGVKCKTLKIQVGNFDLKIECSSLRFARRSLFCLCMFLPTLTKSFLPGIIVEILSSSSNETISSLISLLISLSFAMSRIKHHFLWQNLWIFESNIVKLENSHYIYQLIIHKDTE